MRCLVRFLVLFLALLPARMQGKEYVVPVGDVGAFFAKLPGDATSVVFSAAA